MRKEQKKVPLYNKPVMIPTYYHRKLSVVTRWCMEVPQNHYDVYCIKKM